MSVDRATVRRIARLARLAITEEEAGRLEQELSGILDWVAQLDEIDTSAVEPMTRVAAMTMKTAQGRGHRRLLRRRHPQERAGGR